MPLAHARGNGQTKGVDEKSSNHAVANRVGKSKARKVATSYRHSSLARAGTSDRRE
jgi:hypothetical protein